GTVTLALNGVELFYQRGSDLIDLGVEFGDYFIANLQRAEHFAVGHIDKRIVIDEAQFDEVVAFRIEGGVAEGDDVARAGWADEYLGPDLNVELPTAVFAR